MPDTLSYDVQRARRHLARCDPKMAALMRHVGPYRLETRALHSPFHALMRAITYQQLSGKAAATIFSRVLALFPPQGEPAPAHLLALPDQTLRAAGLSRNKLAALRDLAAHSVQGKLPALRELETMADEEIIRRLTAVRGVGRWTVEMLLIFNLGRPDVLPLDDLGIRKGFRLAYGMRRLPATSTVERAGRAWAPYRSVASWYLWRAVDALKS